MPDFGISRQDLGTYLYKTMKNNDLLVGVNKFQFGYEAVDTMVYLDTNGNIVSDLSYYIKPAYEGIKYQKEGFGSIKITKNSYYDALQKMGDETIKYRAEIETLKASERAKDKEKEDVLLEKRKNFVYNSYKSNKNNS